MSRSAASWTVPLLCDIIVLDYDASPTWVLILGRAYPGLFCHAFQYVAAIRQIPL